MAPVVYPIIKVPTNATATPGLCTLCKRISHTCSFTHTPRSFKWVPQPSMHSEVGIVCHLYSKSFFQRMGSASGVAIPITNSRATKITLGKHSGSLLSSVPSTCQVIIEVQNQDTTRKSKLRSNTAPKDSTHFYQLLPRPIDVGDSGVDRRRH